jgi:hypothetical protein
MTDTIEKLLEEFGDNGTIYTREQFEADRKHGAPKAEAHHIVVEHRYQHTYACPEDEYLEVLARGRAYGYLINEDKRKDP